MEAVMSIEKIVHLLFKIVLLNKKLVQTNYESLVIDEAVSVIYQGLKIIGKISALNPDFMFANIDFVHEILPFIQGAESLLINHQSLISIETIPTQNIDIDDFIANNLILCLDKTDNNYGFEHMMSKGISRYSRDIRISLAEIRFWTECVRLRSELNIAIVLHP